MNLQTVAYYTIQFRRGCDFVPAVSTVNNVVDLVSKIALDIFYHIDSERHEYVRSFSVIKEISQKGYIDAILLAVPFLNIYVAYLRYLAPSDNCEMPPDPPSRGGSRRTRVSIPGSSDTLVETEEESTNVGPEKVPLSKKMVHSFLKIMSQDEEGKKMLVEILERKVKGDKFHLREYVKEDIPKEAKKKPPKIKKRKSNGLFGKMRAVANKGVKIAKEAGKIVLEGFEEGVVCTADEFLNTEEGQEYVRGLLT